MNYRVSASPSTSALSGSVARQTGPIIAASLTHVATRTKADGLEELRVKILESIRGLVGEDADVDIGRLDESVDQEEVLVQVTLADPGENATWDQVTTNAIRTAVREATAEILPSAVATTRLVSSSEDA